ncbi:MAG TPA: DUF1134 domain-containing protein [Propylenella sp.]|nr:DUF1134 domain-containing protein [Propylenella sp.]
MAFSRRIVSRLAALILLATCLAPAATAAQEGSYSTEEIVGAGHQFFGKLSGGLATMVEEIVARYGLPNGYIIGQEGSGAFVGGLRYGEGILYTKLDGRKPVYWQGPSLGFDFGGDGNRTMMLVYDLPSSLAIYRRFGGVNGSAYLVGGLSMTVLANTEVPERTVYVVPIRSGIGARLGINVGYLKFTQRPTLNPF